ncbi:3-phosphoshikimate 1-carboxyvinyltransferase [Neobittarella massiliensis]|uniref:3-phosphoshikimate 1-carboxyvinyltransferase n=1 Tax=Neobittarella massiliensis (ex Bilen et al. 2018) TaxID=2041842 RepID=UPI000CF68DC1|nr:3-phosphoshikimate 1-carboxyvinyltransferase [Neobittarella massiliensis]
MRIAVRARELRGTITAPPSKSCSHRAVICALLAGGTSVLTHLAQNTDIRATLAAANVLGAGCRPLGDSSWQLTGLTAAAGDRPVTIDCGESGSTLRFFVPIAAALGVPATFTGRGRLPGRPIAELLQPMCQNGAETNYAGTLPCTVTGRLQSGVYPIPGHVSSQFITGLLLALPLLEGDSEISLTSRLQSRPYIDLTLQIMAQFGVRAEATHRGWFVPGGQQYQPQEIQVEGDWSGAAFYLTAGAVGGSVTVAGLNCQSRQGDRAVADILAQLGAQIRTGDGMVHSAQAPLHGTVIDGSHIPDIVPILAVAAAAASGTTTFTGVGRLRDKESDRLYTTSATLTALGADVAVGPDGDSLVVRGGRPLHGATVSSFGDHRIAMTAAVAALLCGGQTVYIDGAECIDKSYPNFFEHFTALGGVADVL